jgi:hypothetical protein
VLPLGTILAALVRIGFAFLRPLLLILGAMKVLEDESRSGSGTNSQPVLKWLRRWD